MALKRPQKFLNQNPNPSFTFPGKDVLLQAWNLFIFSCVFAILFNTFYSDGIELKVKPSKQLDLSTVIKNNSSQTPVYTGWKNSPTKTPKMKPTSTLPTSSNIPRLSLMGAKDRFDKKNCVFLDARKSEEYSAGHIPEAINFSALELDQFAPRVMPQLTDKNQEIIVYCNGGDCTLSLELAQILIGQGYNHVEVFEEGWPAWKKAAYPAHMGGTP